MIEKQGCNSLLRSFKILLGPLQIQNRLMIRQQNSIKHLCFTYKSDKTHFFTQ